MILVIKFNYSIINDSKKRLYTIFIKRKRSLVLTDLDDLVNKFLVY